MKININPFKNLRNFFSSKLKNVEDNLEKDSKELHDIEDSLIDIKKDSEMISDNLIKIDWRSDKKMIKFRLFALLVWIIGYFAYNTLNFIFMIISAYIVSMIVESLISWFQSIGFKRWLSIFVSYLIFILSLVLLFLIVAPFLINQTVELVSMWLNYLADFQKNLNIYWVDTMIRNMHILPESLKNYFFEYFGNSDFLSQIQNALQQNLSEIISLWKEYITKAGIIIIGFVSSFTNFLVDFWVFITLAILFSVEKDITIKFLAKLWWKYNYDTSCLKIQKMYKKLGIWLKARLAMSLFISIAMWLALIIMWWFGVEIPNKLWIAVFTWLLDIIPYIGPFISGTILFVVGLLYNTIWVSFLSVWILYIVNVIQWSVLTPLFMNKALWVSSVLIFISMVLGWMIMWFFWVLLAVPIVVIITLLLEDKEQLTQEEEKWFNISNSVLKSLLNFFKKIKSKSSNTLSKK